MSLFFVMTKKCPILVAYMELKFVDKNITKCVIKKVTNMSLFIVMTKKCPIFVAYMEHKFVIKKDTYISPS